MNKKRFFKKKLKKFKIQKIKITKQNQTPKALTLNYFQKQLLYRIE